MLLKAALMAAEDHGLEAVHVRLDELRLPSGPEAGEKTDDADWFLEHYLDADALIASAPIYTRALPGTLKVLIDRVLGPKLDVVMAEEAASGGEPEESSPLGFEVSADPRVLKPRVAGLITVGGCREPQWRSLALPLLHSLTFSTQVAVVDQVDLLTPAVPGGVVTDDATVERTRQLGKAVAQQAGVPYDQARYGGREGTCPVCHLNLIMLRETYVECGTCGARGRFRTDGDRVSIEFPPDGIRKSLFTIEEKRLHSAELSVNATGGPDSAEVERRGDPYRRYERAARPREVTSGC